MTISRATSDRSRHGHRCNLFCRLAAQGSAALIESQNVDRVVEPWFLSGPWGCHAGRGGAALPHSRLESSAGAGATAMAVGACHERDLAPDPTPKDAQIRIRSGGRTRHVCEVSCLGGGSWPRSRNGGNRHFLACAVPQLRTLQLNQTSRAPLDDAFVKYMVVYRRA